MSKEDADMITHSYSIENARCFLCLCDLVNEEEIYFLFEKQISENGYIECSLSDTLSAILSKELCEETAHSKNVCVRCHERIDEYSQLKQKELELKYSIIDEYNRTKEYLSCEDNQVIEHTTDDDMNYSTNSNGDDQSQTTDIIISDVMENDKNQKYTIICSADSNPLTGKGNSRLKIKSEPYDAEQIQQYFDPNSETMVEIIAENDENYSDIIEDHHSSLNGDADGEVDGDVEENMYNETEYSTNLISVKKENEVDWENPHNKKKKARELTADDKPFKFDGQKFLCTICTANNEKENEEYEVQAIVAHLKTAHNIRAYICDICGSDFTKRSDLSEHMDEEHGGTEDGEYNCPTCNRLFTNLRLFRVHKRIHYSTTKLFVCNQCNKKYSSKNLLDEHMNMHTGQRPYKCQHCPKDFASKYTLTAHLKIHSDRPRPFGCKQCSKAFYSMQNLQQHEKTHSGVKEFICQICSKAFGTQHNLEVHKVVHTGYKPFICRTCNKAFARRAEIKDHERIHTGEKPFKCDICGMSFAQRSNLTTHKRATHLNDKRYKCDQCDRSFKRRRLLDYHIRASHTGERPFKCEICGATFVYPEHHKKHLRIHSGVKPYACEVCGKTFNSRDNRNAHRFIHSDKKPYECLVCGHGFMRKPHLYVHMHQSGHVNDTIVINQPRLQTDSILKQEEVNYVTPETVDEIAEEDLIIDGHVQCSGESEEQQNDEFKGEDNSQSSTAEILESDDFAEAISGDQIFLTGDTQYIKTEDGTKEIKLVQIRTKRPNGKDSYTWVNFADDDN